MAKRIKPVATETGDIAVGNEKPLDAATAKAYAEVKSEAERLSEAAPLLDKAAFDEKVKEDLERMESLEKDNARLTSEIAALQDRIAEYIEERDKSTSQTVKMDPATEEKIRNLEKEVSELRDENDRYLMRISELTFDNARLTASMQNMKQDVQQVKAQEQSKLERPAAKPIERVIPNRFGFPGPQCVNPYRNGGYSDWN